MSEPANDDLNRPPGANPTVCLDCGRSFIGTDCPQCREKNTLKATPGALLNTPVPEVILPDDSASTGTPPTQAISGDSHPEISAKVKPTICLECNNSFIGTTECPICRAEKAAAGAKANAGTAAGEPAAQGQAEEPKTVLDEMADLGFSITQID